MKAPHLDQHISDLLLEHDCVIIPGFGGLVANPVSARVDRLQHRFRPPSKEIGFNRNLSNNDGLLANQLVSALEISYSEANLQIEAYVRQLQQKLKNSGTVKLTGIGTLFLDRNQRYRFEPDARTNYRLASFGLTSFHSLPVELPLEKAASTVTPLAVQETAPEPVKRRRQEAFQNKPPIPPPAPVRKRRKLVAYLPLVSIVLLLAAYFVWLPTRTELFTGGQFNYSDLNPFSDKICAVYEFQANLPSHLDEDENDPLALRLKANKSNHLLVNLFDEKDPYYNSAKQIWVEGFRSKIAQPVTTRVSLSTAGKNVRLKYHLIAGCFGERLNADRLIESLRQQGFVAHLVDQNKGLHRVALQSFATRSEALSLLGRLRKEQRNSGTWLLIK